MSFKDTVHSDNKAIFLNNEEFADNHTVIYDGIEYPNIPILLTKVKEVERPEVPGVHLVTATVHIAIDDMCGEIPEQKTRIRISNGEALGRPFFDDYKIVTSDCEMGMLVLELEAVDE